MTLGSGVRGDEAAEEAEFTEVGASRLAAQVAQAFASEPDATASTQRLLELVVGVFSDWGTIHLVQPDGTLLRVAAFHRDPALLPEVERLLALASVDPTATAAIAEPLQTRRVAVHRSSPEELASMAPDAEVLAVWNRLGLSSGVLLPLVASDRVVGVMALMARCPDHFTAPRVAALEGLAAQCALLAETVRLTREGQARETERARARAVFDTLVANAPVAVVVVDTDGRVLHHNPALRELASGAGPGPEGAEPLLLADLMPGIADQVAPLVAAVEDTGTAIDRTEIRTGEPGRRRYWQADAFPIRRGDGMLFGVGVFFMEVTDEKLLSRHQRESLARLDLSLEAGGLGTWDWDLVTGRSVWSPGMKAIIGVEPDRADEEGGSVLDAVVAEDRARMEAELVAAAREQRDYHDEFRVRGPNGEVRWIETRGRVVATRAGTPLRMIGVASDVTERHVMEDVKLRLLEREHQARVAAEASRERLALLAEVSGALGATLDPQSVYEQLAALLVPRLADVCVLDALDDDGGLREMAVESIDPAHVDLIRQMRVHRREAGGDGIWSVRRAMRTGRSERVEDITDDDLVAAAADEEHLAVLRALSPRSALVAPLVARGRVLGGVTLVTTGPRSYEADDQALVEDLAGRVATVIDTAMLFDSRSEVARALQQTLLPPALPEIPGIDLAARYRAAGAGIEIGGDFYDVFESASGWNVVVGDVCGKGPAAAAVTGLFRHTLRAVSPSSDGADGPVGPAAVLSATNDAILDQIDDTRFATAALVILRPGAGRAALTVACGGHPRPMLVRADGAVERVDAAGTLLGVMEAPPLRDVSLDLGPGDALVLYTDGVTEARNGSVQFGESRLREALAGALLLRSAVELADLVIREVDAFRDPSAPADDIAVVVIRVPDLPD